MKRNSSDGQNPQQPASRVATPEQAGTAISAFSTSVLVAPESAEPYLAMANDLFKAGAEAPNDSIGAPTKMMSDSHLAGQYQTGDPSSLMQRDLLPTVKNASDLPMPQAASLSGSMPPESATDYQTFTRERRRQG